MHDRTSPGRRQEELTAFEAHLLRSKCQRAAEGFREAATIAVACAVIAGIGTILIWLLAYPGWVVALCATVLVSYGAMGLWMAHQWREWDFQAAAIAAHIQRVTGEKE